MCTIESYRITLSSLDDTERLAHRIARAAQPPLVIALKGTLGAGKTAWTRAFAAACGSRPEDITSPTFTLVHVYPTKPIIYHIDAYRIHDDDEFLELGMDEMMHADAITIIEWADRVQKCLPADHLQLTLEVVDDRTRIATIDGTGPKSQQLVSMLHATT